MKFDEKYHFVDAGGIFWVEGWLKPHSFDLELKIGRDEEQIKRNPRSCLVLGDLVELRGKLTAILEKHKKVAP